MKKVEQKFIRGNQWTNLPFFPLFFPSFSIRREGLITPAPTTTHPLLLPFTSVCLHSSDKQINILSLLIFTSPIPCNFHKVTSSCLPVRTGRSQAPSVWNVVPRVTRRGRLCPRRHPAFILNLPTSLQKSVRSLLNSPSLCLRKHCVNEN